jgi:hypothetical protein
LRLRGSQCQRAECESGDDVRAMIVSRNVVSIRVIPTMVTDPATENYSYSRRGGIWRVPLSIDGV